MTVRSSPLLTAFLSTLSSEVHQSVASTTSSPLSSSSAQSPSLLPSFEHMDSTAPSTLTKSMDTLLDILDVYKTEENNVSFHTRQIAREKARLGAYVAKRKEENASRVAQGLSPLPEEDVTRLFKIPPEPSRLEGMLLLGQVDGYARSLEDMSANAMVNLYSARS